MKSDWQTAFLHSPPQKRRRRWQRAAACLKGLNPYFAEALAGRSARLFAEPLLRLSQNLHSSRSAEVESVSIAKKGRRQKFVNDGTGLQRVAFMQLLPSSQRPSFPLSTRRRKAHEALGEEVVCLGDVQRNVVHGPNESRKPNLQIVGLKQLPVESVQDVARQFPVSAESRRGMHADFPCIPPKPPPPRRLVSREAAGEGSAKTLGAHLGSLE